MRCWDSVAKTGQIDSLCLWQLLKLHVTLPCELSQILTCVTFDEFVMFNWSNHSGKSSHDIIQLLHLLWVASLQHYRRQRDEKEREMWVGRQIQTNIKQKYERKISPADTFRREQFFFFFLLHSRWSNLASFLQLTTREQLSTCRSASMLCI